MIFVDDRELVTRGDINWAEFLEDIERHLMYVMSLMIMMT